MQSNCLSITGEYLFDSKVLHPSGIDTKEFKQLLILPSKHPGRPDYLVAKIYGSYKPIFLSSIYEPRTKNGMFNVEVCGIRYEATLKPGGKLEICKHCKMEKGVTFE
jgi:hypothetical protein